MPEWVFFVPMNLLKKALKKLDGLHYPQDYLCFAAETFQQPLHLYLVAQGLVLKDITHHHAFVGYCPVVFALPVLAETSNSPVIETILGAPGLSLHEKYNHRQVVAALTLKRINQQETSGGGIHYFEAVKGRHRFTGAFRQAVGQLYNRLYNRRPGNVYLQGNLYKQVQIAYALPRKINLITVGQNNRYNLFPTDLHGQVNSDTYLISLRHAGRACEQVLATQAIVLSEMKAAAFQQVYSLGKNHMQPLKEAGAFVFSPDRSVHGQLPLPMHYTRYLELQLLDSFRVGIHQLLLFRVVGEKHPDGAPQTLVHVHSLYASWRQKNGLPGNYLLR